MFNRQKLFAHNLPPSIRSRCRFKNHFEIGEFSVFFFCSKHMCDAIRHRWRETKAKAKHFCHAPWNTCTLFYSFGRIDTLCCFSWAFCTKELVFEWKKQNRNREKCFGVTKSTTDTCIKKWARVEKNNNSNGKQSNMKKWHSPWTKSWHKQVGVSVYMLEQHNFFFRKNEQFANKILTLVTQAHTMKQKNDTILTNAKLVKIN